MFGWVCLKVQRPKYRGFVTEKNEQPGSTMEFAFYLAQLICAKQSQEPD